MMQTQQNRDIEDGCPWLTVQSDKAIREIYRKGLLLPELLKMLQI